MKAMSLEEYARDTTPFFAANPFYEIETSRRIDLFGHIAHVWSAYEARTSPGDSEPERRGINSIQLFRHPEHGWRIIQEIRRRPELEHLPILVCSADQVALASVEEQLRAAPKMEGLSKPFDIDDLIAALERLLPPDS